jgi:enoyl-CoA hydratase/carnithine racemase
MSYSRIDVQINESIAEITLNHSAKRNTLSFEMIAELTSAFKDLVESEAIGIILGANGPVFCSGHDYRDMFEQDLATMRKLMQASAKLMQLIHTVPQPVVAKVQGGAVGSGCQLVLSCDLVVASEKAWFRTPGGSRGWFCFTPMVAVTRAVGRKRALEMLMVGDPIPAELASEWGMINRVVPPERLDAEARDLITRATHGSALMKGLGKHAYYAQIDLDEAHAYEYAAELMASTGVMADPQERMKAFVQKRARVSSRNGA